MARPRVEHTDTRAGFVLALVAYLFWGLMPFYMKAVAHIHVLEVLAHRIVWSVPIAAIVLLILRRGSELKAAFRSPRTLGIALVTAALATTNWGVFIYAVGADRTLEAALGYYINPLFSVFLAAVFLGERLSRLQMVAIALAACAVALVTWDAGGLPSVALLGAGSWGLYALSRRALTMEPNQAFTLEILLISVPCIVFIGYSYYAGTSHFGPTGSADVGLLVLGGFVTAAPLMIYCNAARGLKLSTIGMMQYITPTMVFLIAVFIFGEPLPPARAIAFAIIWVALALYSVSVYGNARRRSRDKAAIALEKIPVAD
ncbi:MAG: EamA family transporter RarD [Flavobacteriaceae bacterium]